MEAVEMGFVDIRWIQTKLNIADLFTKPVSRQVLEALVPLLTGYGTAEQWEPISRATAPADPLIGGS
jgi:hypothetical protein